MGVRERAIERVEYALYHWGMNDDLQDDLTDILADLRHWADAKGLDFSCSDGRAYKHYLDERKEASHE